MTDNTEWNKSSYYGDEDDDPDRSTVYGRRAGAGPFYGATDDDDYDDEDDDVEEEEKKDVDPGTSRSGYGASYTRDRQRPGASSYGTGATGATGSSGYGGTGSNYGSGASRYGGSTAGSGSTGSSGYGGSSYSGASSGDKPAKASGGGGVGAVLGKIGLGKKADKPATPRRAASGGGLGSRLSGLRGKLPGGKDKSSSTPSPSTSSAYGGRASTVRNVGERSSSGRSGKSGGKSRFSFSLPFLRRGSSSARPSQPPTRRSGKRAKDLPKSSRTPRIKNEGLSVDTKLDIAGWGLLILAAIIFFGAISSNPGDLSGTLLRLIYQLVGIGWLAVPFALGGTGVWLIWRRFGENAPEADAFKIVGYVVAYVGLLTTFQYVHLLSTPVFSLDQLRTLSEQAALQGYGGGWIGSTAYLFLIQNLGDVGTFFALLGWLGAGLILATDLTLVGIVTVLREMFGRLAQRYQFARNRRSATQGKLATPVQPDVERLTEGGVAALSSRSSAVRALSASDAIPVDKGAPLIRRRGEPVSVEAEAEPETAASPRGYEAPSSGRYAPFSERAAPTNRALADEDLEEAEVYTAPGYAARETGDSHLPLKRGEDVLRVRRRYFGEDEADDLEDDTPDEIETAAETPAARPAFYERSAFYPANIPAAEALDEPDEPDDEPAAEAAMPAPEAALPAQPAEDRESGYGLAQGAHYTEPPPPAYDDDEDEDDAVEDLDTLFQPAQPRNPDRVRQLRPLRERGAGTLPGGSGRVVRKFRQC